jgi:hypothetical protein
VRNRLAPKLVNQPTRRHSPGPAQDSQASATKAALVASIYRCLTKSRFTWEPECCPRIAGRNRPSRTAPTRRTPRRIATLGSLRAAFSLPRYHRGFRTGATKTCRIP